MAAGAPGIDLAGVVEHSAHPHWKPGDRVVVNGWGLGETHWGGLAQRARVDGDCLLALPPSYDCRQAMAVGTAGYTAALCVMALQRHGLKPAMGPVRVTAEGNAMQVVLYGPRDFAEMTPDERVRACYFPAVLKFLSGDRMRSASSCARLGIAPRNAAQATGVLNRPLEAGLIRIADAEHPRGGDVPHRA